jgi:hypothetical protein
MIRAEVGNYGTQKIRGMVNMPLVGDKLAIRAAGSWSSATASSPTPSTTTRSTTATSIRAASA